MIEPQLPASWITRRERQGLWPKGYIHDDVAHWAKTSPHKSAVVDPSRHRLRVLDFAELDQASRRLCRGLGLLGIGRGDTVAFQVPNWWEFTVIQLALSRLGAISMPILASLRSRELTFMLTQTKAPCYIAPRRFKDTDYASMIDSLGGALPHLRQVLIFDENETDPLAAFSQDDDADGPPLSPSDLTQLLYTSGTSGEPKGVLHSHQSLRAGLDRQIRHLGLSSRDVVFIPSPLAHQTGFLYGMWDGFRLGATQVLQDVWDGPRALQLIKDHGCSFVQAATPFLADLTLAAETLGTPPSALRLFVATGAPIPRQLAQRAHEVLGTHVVGAWGTTEGGLVTAGTPDDPIEKAAQTDGKLLPDMALRIVDEDLRDLPAGREGRLLVDTPAMFAGYLNHPEWYRNAFVEDYWFDTGDLAVVDGDGYMRITGRLKDVINRGGEKVPVVEVEELCYAHPSVQEVAIVGMPDPRLGERACAFIVTKANCSLTLPELTAHLERCGMAKIYWPERLELVAQLPRTASGKIQKAKLRQVLANSIS